MYSFAKKWPNSVVSGCVCVVAVWVFELYIVMCVVAFTLFFGFTFAYLK